MNLLSNTTFGKLRSDLNGAASQREEVKVDMIRWEFQKDCCSSRLNSNAALVCENVLAIDFVRLH